MFKFIKRLFGKDNSLIPAEPLPQFYKDLVKALIDENYEIDEHKTTLTFEQYSVSIVVTPCHRTKDKLNITIVPHPNNGVSDINPLLLDEPNTFLFLFIQSELKSLLNPIPVV